MGKSSFFFHTEILHRSRVINLKCCQQSFIIIRGPCTYFVTRIFMILAVNWEIFTEHILHYMCRLSLWILLRIVEDIGAVSKLLRGRKNSNIVVLDRCRQSFNENGPKNLGYHEVNARLTAISYGCCPIKYFVQDSIKKGKIYPSISSKEQIQQKNHLKKFLNISEWYSKRATN